MLPTTSSPVPTVGAAMPENAVTCPEAGRGTHASLVVGDGIRLMSCCIAPGNESVASSVSERPFGFQISGRALRIAMSPADRLGVSQDAELTAEAAAVELHLLGPRLGIVDHGQDAAQDTLSAFRPLAQKGLPARIVRELHHLAGEAGVEIGRGR